MLFKIFIANKISSIEGGDKSIKKFVKPKIKKLSELKNCLNFKNWLNQEKNRQKMGIYLYSILKKTDQAF